MDVYNYWTSSPITTGTTIIAAEYRGGVILGADTRTTDTVYVANRVTDKISKITDNIYVCRSGSAADTQAVAEVTGYHMNLLSIEMGKESSVYCGANIVRELCYNNRDKITVGMIVGGWDHMKLGQVYSIPLGGMCIRQPIALGGSGCTYIYGFVDAHYQKGMEKEECVELIVNALALAMERDGSSGGCVRLAIIDKSGCERRLITGDQLPSFGEIIDFDFEDIPESYI